MLSEKELIDSYPYPIAKAYLPAQRAIKSLAASRRDKVNGLTALGETTAQYLAALVIAQYCAYGLRDKMMEAELDKFARQPGKMSFGTWVGLIGHGVRAFENSGFEKEAIVPPGFINAMRKGELLELCQTILNFVASLREPVGKLPYQVSCHQVLEVMVQFRNLVAHRSALSEEELAALDYGKLLTALRAWLSEMSFLAHYPLVYIEKVSAIGGKNFHEILAAMGTTLTSQDAIPFDHPLNEDRFYLQRPERAELLVCLGPLLKHKDGEVVMMPESEQAQMRLIATPRRQSLFGLIPQESIDSYTQAVRNALEGGAISGTHQRNLETFATQLGIPAWFARQIEEEIKAATPPESRAAPATRPSVEWKWEYALGKPIRKISMGRLTDSPRVWLVAANDDPASNSLYLIDDTARDKPRLILEDSKSRVETAACSEDGAVFAVGCWDGRIHVFGERGNRRRAPHNLGNVVKDIAFSKDGSRLAATTWGEAAFLFDLEHDTTLRELPLTDAGRCIAIEREGHNAVVGTYHGWISFFEPGTAEPRAEEIGDSVAHLAIVEGNRIVAASADGQHITSLNGQGRRSSLSGGTLVSDMAVSRDGHEIVIAHSGRRLAFLHDTGDKLLAATGEDEKLDGNIVHVAISDDGRWCFAATDAGLLYVYEEKSPRWRWQWDKLPADFAISADGRRVAIGFVDGTIGFFELPPEIMPAVAPKIAVLAITPAQISCSKWSILEIEVQNQGNGVAREVSATITGAIKPINPPVLESLRPNETLKLECNVRATDPGMLLLEFGITYRSDSGSGLLSNVSYTDDSGKSRTGTRFSKRFEAV